MLGFVGSDCRSTHVADDNRRSTTDSTSRVVDKGKQRLSVIRQSVCQRYYAISEITTIAKWISFRDFTTHRIIFSLAWLLVLSHDPKTWFSIKFHSLRDSVYANSQETTGGTDSLYNWSPLIPSFVSNRSFIGVQVQPATVHLIGYWLQFGSDKWGSYKRSSIVIYSIYLCHFFVKIVPSIVLFLYQINENIDWQIVCNTISFNCSADII